MLHAQDEVQDEAKLWAVYMYMLAHCPAHLARGYVAWKDMFKALRVVKCKTPSVGPARACVRKCTYACCVAAMW